MKRMLDFELGLFHEVLAMGEGGRSEREQNWACIERSYAVAIASTLTSRRLGNKLAFVLQIAYFPMWIGGPVEGDMYRK